MKLSLVVFGTLAFVLTLNQDNYLVEATSNPKTICYYESWVHWRTGEGKIDPSEIGMSIC